MSVTIHNPEENDVRLPPTRPAQPTYQHGASRYQWGLA